MKLPPLPLAGKTETITDERNQLSKSRDFNTLAQLYISPLRVYSPFILITVVALSCAVLASANLKYFMFVSGRSRA